MYKILHCSKAWRTSQYTDSAHGEMYYYCSIDWSTVQENVILPAQFNNCGSCRSWCDGLSDQSLMMDSLSYFRSSQCSTTDVVKAVLYAILSVRWYVQKNPICQSKRVVKCSGGSRFPLWISEWSFTICPTPCNNR